MNMNVSHTGLECALLCNRERDERNYRLQTSTQRYNRGLHITRDRLRALTLSSQLIS